GGRFNVLSVQSYLLITGTDDLQGGATLALTLLVPSAALYVLQNHLLERKSFVTVTGKPPRASGLSVGGTGRALFGAASLAMVGTIVIFYGLVVFGSLVRVWGADSTLTLQNYRKAFELGAHDITDSLILAGLSAPLSTIFAVAAAWLIERKRFFGRRAIEVL